MTPDAKRQLAATIRALRKRLVDDLHGATEAAYRLSVRPRDAGLDEAEGTRRRRLEAWLDEQERAEAARGKLQRTRADFRRAAELQAAYTLLNRLVLLRLLEAAEPARPAVATGGWESRGYHDFRQLAQALVRGDESEGYGFLLQLVFEDLAMELPGLFGASGVAELVPLPTATLRHVVEALDDPGLASCWADDMTLGWVYQYWNDPEREALDAKLNAGGKVDPHEIASKTQMFTERYMVDWLLQNSLGPLWLAMCKKHGWKPEAEADGTLARLDARRTEWRAKREGGEVVLTELMPLETDQERRWAYYVLQPIPEDAVARAPRSVRDLRLLDPAVGSGHFLVVAFDLLFALYAEEARHRAEDGSEAWSARAVVESILEHNLCGIDLDPRAVQIAAAALWLKARRASPDAHPRRMNLVASSLDLARLADDDPARIALEVAVERETGIPGELIRKIVHALEGADHLGSLLRIDDAVETSIDEAEQVLEPFARRAQPGLFGEPVVAQPQLKLERVAARASVRERLEAFLAGHTGGDDLGLRLRGEQLAAGVRFVRLLREGSYDLVVGNPPYQGTSKMADAAYVKAHYPKGKADLYAAFLERGLQLVRDGGTSALLTMRNWMFIKQYAELRTWLLETYDLRALGDLSSGAFEEISAAQVVVSVVMSSFWKRAPADVPSVALRLFEDETLTKIGETERKRAAVLAQVGRHEFEPKSLKVVPEWPVVYWWDSQLLARYGSTTKIGDVSPARSGLSTQSNTRFLRRPWEIERSRLYTNKVGGQPNIGNGWVPYIKGAAGKLWFESLDDVVNWQNRRFELDVWVQSYTESKPGGFIKHEQFYFQKGIAFAAVGNAFSARAHRFCSVFGSMGSLVFPSDVPNALCSMNTRWARYILESVNPSIHFEVADINRLPLFEVELSREIVGRLETAFTTHEAHREPSVEYRHPGPSPWRHAQDWAQLAVDRPDGAPLPPYDEVLDPEPPTDHLSFALGVALGRFGPSSEGILDPATANLAHALPAGILFLDGTLDPDDEGDGLGHPAAVRIADAWRAHGPAIDPGTDLRSYLRTRLFTDVHRKMYDNRPIDWPLSSDKKTFVAWISIHRWNEATLRLLLADNLHPALARLDGEVGDLREARSGADKKAARAAEKRFSSVQKWREELDRFIADVTACAEQGTSPTGPGCTAREADARYAPDLDDGVMINSAALWPLLEPQWKDPKKWYAELSNAKGKKDYDWAHLAMRYWPARVDAKAQAAPSLGVAHGCFWKYHPARAWSWELRLQDEIGPDFRIEEAPYRGDGGDTEHRAAYLAAHPNVALAAVEKEALRRLRKKKAAQTELRLLEPGLWTALAEACRDLELRVSEKQGVELRLLAPDADAARAALVARDPEREKARAARIAGLVPSPKLFPDEEPEEEDDVEPENGAEPDDAEDDA